METFSPLLAICAGNSPVPGEFTAQRPVTRGFDVFFDLHPNKLLSKQWWGWWFETPLCPLWRHRNALTYICSGTPGNRLNTKTVFPGMVIPIIKIRRSSDRLIFILGINILVRRRPYIETAPGRLWFRLIACYLFGTKAMLVINRALMNNLKTQSRYRNSYSRKSNWKCCMKNVGYFVSALMC